MWALELQSLNRPLFFSEICSINYRLVPSARPFRILKCAKTQVTRVRSRLSNPLVKIVNGVLIDLPSPVNFSMW